MIIAKINVMPKGLTYMWCFLSTEDKEREDVTMKCQNCGTEFEGDICPTCNTPVVSQTETINEDVKIENVSSTTQAQNQNTYAYQGAEPPKIKKKISKRLIFEIVGGILLIIFMFSSLGKVSKTDYDELKSNYSSLAKTTGKYESQIAELQKTKDEYTEYKKRMKPFEELEASEAEARKIEADKVVADKKAADDKAAAEKKAQEEAAAQAAAEKAAADKAAAAKAASATIGQKNALSKAKSYLRSMSFSYSGLIEQLEYEGYSPEDATYAVDNCEADWNEQAALKAKSYMDSMSFSRQGLIDQLIYEGFSAEQAEHGVSAVGY